MNRPLRFGFDGTGRSLGYGGAPKVSRGEITSAYDVDVRTLTAMQDVFDNEDKKSLMKRPGEGGFRLLEGEKAFKVRGGGSRVLTALNGLDAEFVEVYPNDREMVRDLLSMVIQPIGIVREDARTDQDAPQVTLRVGGSCPDGAPNIYNVKGQEGALITTGCAIVWDVPSLTDPVQFGTRAGGRAENKVMLVARAADKRSTARMIQNLMGHILHDPARFKKAMKEHPRVANAMSKVTMRAVTSYKMAFLMGVDHCLKHGILQVVGAPTPVLPNGQPAKPSPALLGAPAGDGSYAALSSEDTTARLAELVGVLDKRQRFGTLSAPEKAFWSEFEFNINQRMIPVPDPRNEAYNASNEFGMVRDRANNTWVSKGRIGQSGNLKRDPIGRLLEKSLTHFPLLLEAFTEANFEERRKMMGTALTTPSLADTCIFDMQIIPHGGLSDVQ